METTIHGRLQRPVDSERDHVFGPTDAPVTIVEYGDYQCSYCASAHAGIKRLRDRRLGNRLRFVFRHFPNRRLHPHSWLAAEAAEAAGAQGHFWEMHEYLLTHQDALDRDGLVRAADALDLDAERFVREIDEHTHAQAVAEDFDSGRLSGAHATPTFFINGRRYDGAWDDDSVMEAIEEPLGLKMRLLAQEFAGLSASAGLMMLIFALGALLWANSPWGETYDALWQTELAITLGQLRLPLSLQHWINDGLIVIFFFVLGLEIKREIVAGELSDPKEAALPIAAAIGGMTAPATIYLLFNAGTEAAPGWGVPMATDTAFALGLMAMLGRRVPLALKVFVAALAIADDVGAIAVLALFYSENISAISLLVATALLVCAAALNWIRVYRVLPYAIVGIALWLAVLFSGVHATLAGVLLALTIPTRSPPDTVGLRSQSMAAFYSLEAPAHGERDESRYQSTVRTLETVVDRLLSPAQRMERNLQPWSAYLILPLFALANAGIVLSHGALSLLHTATFGVVAGLVVGKPLGIVLAAWLAVRLRLAREPTHYSWLQLLGGACLCGVGFTMSIFVATAAFGEGTTLALVKLSVMVASLLAGAMGWLVLRRVSEPSDRHTPMGTEDAVVGASK